MSRFYILPNVPINIQVIGGKGPYTTPPFNYSLSNKDKLGCDRCNQNCRRNLKGHCKCNQFSRYESYPRRAMICDHNYKYYDTSDNMLRDKVDWINYQTERDIRRGLRRPDIRKNNC